MGTSNYSIRGGTLASFQNEWRKTKKIDRGKKLILYSHSNLYMYIYEYIIIRITEIRFRDDLVSKTFQRVLAENQLFGAFKNLLVQRSYNGRCWPFFLRIISLNLINSRRKRHCDKQLGQNFYQINGFFCERRKIEQPSIEQGFHSLSFLSNVEIKTHA